MEFLDEAVLIDTSAIIALKDSQDQDHITAVDFFNTRINKVQWGN